MRFNELTKQDINFASIVVAKCWMVFALPLDIYGTQIWSPLCRCSDSWRYFLEMCLGFRCGQWFHISFMIDDIVQNDGRELEKRWYIKCLSDLQGKFKVFKSVFPAQDIYIYKYCNDIQPQYIPTWWYHTKPLLQILRNPHKDFWVVVDN